MKTMTQQLSFATIAEEPENTQLAEQEISTEVLVEKYAKGAELNVPDVPSARRPACPGCHRG